ncbi:hypothetical protein V9L24_32995 [Streptomyces sp. CCNWLW230]
MRSQHAVSKAASADWATSPTRPYSCHWKRWASSSVSNGSLPRT